MTGYSTSNGRGRSRSQFVNALLGAVVMVVFSWIPFAPVVGGAIAGYLEADRSSARRSPSDRGLRVGAFAGLIATIPAVVVVAFAASIFTVGWAGLATSSGMGPRAGLALPVLGWFIVAVGLLAVVAYHVGLSALGGWVGAQLADRDVDDRAMRGEVDDRGPREDPTFDETSGDASFDAEATGDDDATSSDAAPGNTDRSRDE